MNYELLLRRVLDCARDCGLKTFHEAILNYEMHGFQLHSYKEQSEILEMLNLMKSDFEMANLTIGEVEKIAWTDGNFTTQF